MSKSSSIACFLICVCLVLFVSAGDVLAAAEPVPDATEAFSFVSPISTGRPWFQRAMDPGLQDYLTVTAQKVEPEGALTRFDSVGPTAGQAKNPAAYQVVWKNANLARGDTYQLSVYIKGVDPVPPILLGTVTQQADKRTDGMPIRFQVTAHPTIRARVLHIDGLSSTEIAEALKEEFNLTPDVVASLLAYEKFDATEVAKSLSAVYSFNAKESAALLKALGYTVNSIADVLKGGFSLNDVDTAVVLKAVGFDVSEVADALKTEFYYTGETAALLLHQIDYTAQEIAQVLKSVWHTTAGETVALLKQIGYNVEVEIGKLLMQIGYTSGEIGDALVSVWEMTAGEAAVLLEQIGYGVDEIGHVLMSTYLLTQDAATSLLKGLFGTVICSELYRQGLMDHTTYAADVAYGKWLAREYPFVMKGYRFLAAPIVRAMQSSRIFAEIISVVARPWAHEMAFQMGVGSSGSLIGKLMMAVGIPVCGLVGAFLSLSSPTFYAALILLLIGVAVTVRRRRFVPA